MSESPKSETNKFESGTIEHRLYYQLKDLDTLCGELKDRVLEKGENPHRTAEINNILCAVIEAIRGLEEDGSDAFSVAVEVHVEMRKRLFRLKADSKYLGRHGFIKD